MGKDKKTTIITSFTYGNFSYFPLVWLFCSCKSSKKFENIQKCCLGLELDDYQSDYVTLIKKWDYNMN